MRQPAQPITRAVWSSFKFQPEPFNESERACPHHGFSRERIATNHLLGCDLCFSGLTQTFSLSSLVGHYRRGSLFV